MLALGIEGTAHTYGAGVVCHLADGTVEVLANARELFSPPTGGIHPREAANHHAEVAGDVLDRAFRDAGVSPAELDVVAFSQGPGLGPCLRTAATTARALALAAGKPLVGVNHCVAHLEIGRAVTDAEDPVLLYASGGNTQVIAFTEGRYRVFGETLDVGVGNLLDKFAREVGIPFPGGPEVEKLAAKGEKLLELPYTLKGMDVAFSGILTAALAHVQKGARLEDVSHSLQETAFAMLVEVTERALAHTEKTEVVLGGGVACNERLWGMTRLMCKARGARAHRPEKPLLVDNGAMIAHLGLLQFEANHRQGRDLAGTKVEQRQRTDDVLVTWREETRTPFCGLEAGAYEGAEARVECTTLDGHETVTKTRTPRPYRLPALDRAVRTARVRAEAKALSEARRAGVRTPLVLEARPGTATLVLERVPGRQLKEVLDGADPAAAAKALRSFGSVIARLHAASLLHGDLTTSNALLGDEGLVLLDFGLASTSEDPEDRGVDLHVLKEALEATHARLPDAFRHVLAGYVEGGGDKQVLAKLKEIERRGRYRGT